MARKNCPERAGALEGRLACLLANHGAIACGVSLRKAFWYWARSRSWHASSSWPAKLVRRWCCRKMKSFTS
jgi:hypothetical protein